MYCTLRVQPWCAAPQVPWPADCIVCTCVTPGVGAQAEEEVAETSSKLEELQGANLCDGLCCCAPPLLISDQESICARAVSAEGAEVFGEKKKKKKKVRVEDVVRTCPLVPALDGSRGMQRSALCCLWHKQDIVWLLLESSAAVRLLPYAAVN